jgi:hypothetical protein
MNSVKSVKKPPLTRFGGRPPKFTFEAKTVLLDALRAGKAYASACIAAGITPVTLFSHRRADARFDAQCRAARATGKKQPNAMPGQATMIDSYGNIVPSSEIVVDAKEQARLQRAFDKRQKDLRRRFVTKDAVPQTRKRSQPANGADDRIKRLIKLRQDYEADLRKAEAESGNVVATRDAQLSESTVLQTVQGRPVERVEAQLARPEPPAGVFLCRSILRRD